MRLTIALIRLTISVMQVNNTVTLLTISVLKIAVSVLNALVYVRALHLCKVTYGMYILTDYRLKLRYSPYCTV